MGIRLEFLGPVQVGDESGIDIGRPARRRLLSILALAGGGRVSTEVLIDRFWPESPPETARAAIQTHVSGLRRQLGDDVLVTEGYGYRLNLADHALDVDAFTELAAEANRHRGDGDWDEALKTTNSALELWRGPPFAELADDEFARAEITRLEEIHLGLLEHRAEALIGLDRADAALPDLEALVVEHPYRERFWEHLMTARYRVGRHTEALHAFQEVLERLAEIGAEPGAPLRRLEEKILLHDRSLTQTKHNLPVELDSFVGRATEIKEATQLVADNRLLTLTGTGGSGKTRLATHIARQLLDQYPDGIWYVELASLDDPDLIPTEIAQVIGLSPAEDAMRLVGKALSDDRTLIILDNCEHLLEGASTVTRAILESAPAARVIATSREALRVPGEAVFDVPGMTVPDLGSSVGSPLGAYDATRLFLERAQLARSPFEVDDVDRQALVDICHRLDGMPLAIELAAAQTATMAVEELRQRLGDRFNILTSGALTAPSRHATLEAAIDWSYRLLSDEERAVLHQLSVFRAGFDVEMAEQVWTGTAVVPILSSLVSKSLVTRYKSPVGRRYRLLETIRDFALLRLEESGETVEARNKHLEWCVGFASRVRRRFLVGPRNGLMDLLHHEADDLSEALLWSESRGRATDAGLLSEALAKHWSDLSRFSAAVSSLEQAIVTCEEPTRKAHLHAQLARALFWVADNERALGEAQRGYELAADLPSSPEKVVAICELADEHMLEVDQDPGIALRLAREAVTVSLEVSNPLTEIRARRELANALAWNGQTEAGITEARTVLEMARRIDDGDLLVESAQWLMHVQYMDPVARRRGPGEVLELLRSEFADDHPFWAGGLARGWVPWAMIQRGEFEGVESTLKTGSRRVEDWALVENRILRGVVHWMKGDLEQAWEDVLLAEREGINPRWYHDYYPLRVDVLTDRGELEQARESADFYLNTNVHSTEEIKKVGVLNPLVRASVEMALAQRDQAEELIAQAGQDVTRIERIITEFPQPIEGSIAMETPPTHLAFARAELSRVTGPNPALWRDALNRADYFYFRLYARLRLAEALLATGETKNGTNELAEVRAEAAEIGAELLVGRADATAERFGVVP